MSTDHQHLTSYWIGSHVPCVNAITEAERIGPFVDEDVSPLLPDPSDRFWWLVEGKPVRHVLTAIDRTDGGTVASHDIPDDKVPALRALFSPKPDDPNFYDVYKVDQSRRARVSEILGIPLDLDLDYDLWTYSVK